MNNNAEKLIDFARSQGLIRSCDLAQQEIPRVSLTRAVRQDNLSASDVGSMVFLDEAYPLTVHWQKLHAACPKGLFICCQRCVRHGMA